MAKTRAAVVKAAGIDEKKFLKYVKYIDECKAAVEEQSGNIGDTYKSLKMSMGIHTPALKLAIKLKNMEADKREEFLCCLEDYLALMYVKRQTDLFRNRADDAADEAAEGGEKNGKGAGAEAHA
jgi:uncharacterized protein (UPF0335 family)